MNASKPNALARVLRGFFADHLPRVRGSSPHTILSYRDTLVLFLRFVADRKKQSVTQLEVSDLDPPEVLAFLEHLETTRNNLVATRNVRLAAIHAFFRYCATADPTRVEHCQRVLAIPFKRTGSRPIHHLEYDEIQAVLASVDRTKADGRRDYILLATMFNTGARVQEIVNLQINGGIAIRRGYTGMAQPLTDRCDLHARTKEMDSSVAANRGTLTGLDRGTRA